MEEMNCRTTGEKASIFPRKSAADILAAVKRGKLNHCRIDELYQQSVETDVTLTELHSCAKRNDVEMAIELVLNDGMDVNVATERNITPLLWASAAASRFSIKTLIDLGADVNAQVIQGKFAFFYGGTALHTAIHGNNAAVVEVLLANMADPNIGDKHGNTALHSSTYKRFFHISRLLMDFGCEINARNSRGKTPLHLAVSRNDADIVEVLLKNKADPNIQDSWRNTALHLSTIAEFSDISQLLIDSGCSTNLKNWEGKTPLDVKPFSLRFGESPEVKARKVNTSQKNTLDEIFDETKDEEKDDPWMKLPTVSSSVAGKLKEQKTTRNLVFLLKTLRELSSNEGSEPGATWKRLIDWTALDLKAFLSSF